MRTHGRAALKRGVWLALAALPVGAQATEGWYLGLEGGANWVDAQDFRVYNYDPPILTRPVADGTNIGTAKLDTGWLGGLTFGYDFGNGFRSDLELAYRQNDFKSLQRYAVGPIRQGGTTTNVRGDEEVVTGMLNVWYDFLRDSRFHPYVGAGAGAARFALNGGQWDNIELNDRFDTVFAWQLGAGLAYELTPKWTASLDYRYLKTSGGASFDLFPSNPNTHVETDYEAQSAMLSLRYSFGSPPAPVHQVSEPVAVVPVEEPAPLPPPPPPPPPVCKQPEAGEALSLDGCKAGDKLVLRGVNFDFDKATLTLNAKALLDQVADELNKHADVKVEIDGHTDAKGADAYNQKLSQRRADAVKAYLVEKSIAAERMTTKGYGESMPIADNGTDEGREQNRRVELKITEGGEPVAPTTAGDVPASGDTAAPLGLSDAPTTSTAPVDPLAAQ